MSVVMSLGFQKTPNAIRTINYDIERNEVELKINI